MQVRAYQSEDLAALRAIHAAQGFDYAFPDLSNPLFVTKLVLVDDAALSLCGDAAGCAAKNLTEPANSGATSCATTKEPASPSQFSFPGREPAGEKILGAALLRLTAEAYFLLDPAAGTPRRRWQSLLALHEAARRQAWQRGLEDVHAWLPPPIARTFGRRLERLGWVRDDAWTPYCNRLQIRD